MEGRFPGFPVRILMAASRGRLLEPLLRAELDGASVRVADSRDAIKRAMSEGPRFDLAVIDLTWEDSQADGQFDGLDALKLIHQRDRDVPVIFAVRGCAAERDHVDEAAGKPRVAGFCLKEFGPRLLAKAITSVMKGERLTGPEFPWCGSPPGTMRIDEYFARGARGKKAAQLAAAIASGRAVDAPTLKAVAGVSRAIASRPKDYLAPLISGRGEHPVNQQVTSGVLYRWCGEHARYIQSWYRRNGITAAAERDVP